MNNLKKKNEEEVKHKEADEEADTSIEETTTQDADKDSMEMEGKRARDLFDSFTPPH